MTQTTPTGLWQVIRWTAFLAISPYLGLVAYLRWQMHAESAIATAPGAAFLAVIAVLGVGLPALGVGSVLRHLVAQRHRFFLRPLLAAYVCLIVLFASGYALLQARAGTEPSFHGMVRPWAGEASFFEHLAQLHALFFDSLYLSVVTITTVGFGDVVPLTTPAKLLAASEGLTGIGFVGLALGHYFSVCTYCGSVSGAAPSRREDGASS